MIAKGTRVEITNTRFVHVINEVRVNKKTGKTTYHAYKERYLLKQCTKNQLTGDRYGVYLTEEDIINIL